MKKRVKLTRGKRYEIDVQGMTHEGDGVGRVGGTAVFIQGALPGEKVKATVIRVSKRYAVARLDEILKASPERIEPKCPHANECGGCSLLHLNYPGQLNYKTQQVKDALERIGHIKTQVLDTIGMETPWRYRNKVQFPVGQREGHIIYGFYARRSHQIIGTGNCRIQPQISNDVAELVKDWMMSFNVKPYDEKTLKGLVRHVIVRTSQRNRQLMVILVINGREIPNVKDLVQMLAEQIPGFTCLLVNTNMKDTNVIMGKENTPIFGQPYIYDSIGDVGYRLSPRSFFQINPIQVEIPYEKTLEYAGLTGKETVIDAYCGIGGITLFLARKAKKIYGIEVVPEAVEDARYNADMNDIENAQFLQGPAEELMPKLAKEGVKPQVIVVDPPRKGCDEKLLDAMVYMKPERIVYVSCNPSTLARDLRYLEDKGYKTLKVQPVDMFPHTSHVECVALMSRVEK